ncbi:MAG: hypothetical protein WCL70_12990 [Paludibacter sp.]
MERIKSIGNLSIDFDRIRAIKLDNYNREKSNILLIEYNARIEYSKNPFTQEIEKTEIIDVISKEFPNFETASLHQKEIEVEWQEYLESKTKFDLLW